MKEASVRDIFHKVGLEHGYELLPEVPMVRESADSFFVMASVAAHMDLFQPGASSEPAKYRTVQRVFSSSRFEDVGRYPLATSFEVMLSVFRFQDTTSTPALEFTHDFLARSIGASTSDLIYLAPNAMGLREAVLQKGALEEHVVSWDEGIPLKLGKDRGKGDYIKIFLPYRHGLMPVATLGFMELDGGIALDSAFFLERLTVVQEGVRTWYEGSHFAPLVATVDSVDILKSLPMEEKYLWSNHLRALLALMRDGAVPSAKGPGHTLRKMARQLAGTIAPLQLSADDADRLVAAGEECLAAAGYERVTREDAASHAEILGQLINRSSTQIGKELLAFERRIVQDPLVDPAELETWRSERGLQFEWMKRVAERSDVRLDLPDQETRFWLRNECYTFDESQPIEDPVGFLAASEERRMKHAKPS